jgi:hypothetical protein
MVAAGSDSFPANDTKDNILSARQNNNYEQIHRDP